MIVPSRSIKTAGESVSVIFTIFSETGDKFITRYRRRSKFADHNGASVVGDLRRFGRGCSADQSKGKERNGCIARARYIENLPCLGGDVMRRFIRLKKHHPMFPESDQNVFCFPSLEKRFASAPEINILRRDSISITAGNTGREQGFGTVWLNYCDTMPI